MSGHKQSKRPAPVAEIPQPSGSPQTPEERFPELQQSVVDWTQDQTRAVVHLMLTQQPFFAVNMRQLKPAYIKHDMLRALLEEGIKFHEQRGHLPSEREMTSVIHGRFVGEPETIAAAEQETARVYRYHVRQAPDSEFLQTQITEFCKDEAHKEFFRRGFEIIVNRQDERRYERVRAMFEEASAVGEEQKGGMWYFEEVGERYKQWQEDLAKGTNRFPTGFTSIDATLEGGMKRKEIGLILGLAKRGKSFMLLHLAHEALRKNYKVLFISLENSLDVTARRLDSKWTGLSADRLLENWEIEVKAKLQEAANFHPRGLYLLERPAGDATIAELRAEQQKLYTTQGWVPDMVCLDYVDELRLLPDMKRYESEEESLKQFRGWMQKIGACGWTVTQGNRDGASVDVLDEGQQAGGFGKFRKVDWMASANMKDVERDAGLMTLFVMGARNAPSRSKIFLETDFSRAHFAEIPKPVYEQRLREAVERQRLQQMKDAAAAKMLGGSHVK